MIFNFRGLIPIVCWQYEQLQLTECKKIFGNVLFWKYFRLLPLAQVKNAYSQLRSRLVAIVAAEGSFFK